MNERKAVLITFADGSEPVYMSDALIEAGESTDAGRVEVTITREGYRG